MSKKKTHSGAKKRFSFTGKKKARDAKIKMFGVGGRHNLFKKTKNRKRALRKKTYVSKSDAASIRKLI